MKPTIDEVLVQCLNDQIFRKMLIALQEEISLNQLSRDSGYELSHMSKKRIQWQQRLGFAVAHLSERRLILTEKGSMLARAAMRVENELQDQREQLLRDISERVR